MVETIIQAMRNIVNTKCMLEKDFLYTSFKTDITIDWVTDDVSELTSELNTYCGINYAVRDTEDGKKIKIAYIGLEIMTVNAIMIESAF